MSAKEVFDNITKIACLIFVGAIFFIIAYAPQRKSSIDNNPVADTIYDTITYTQPIPKDSVIVRYVKLKVSTYDTIRIERIDSVEVDGTYVSLPIVQKQYSDSSYKAWVSGYEANLDSIKIFQREITKISYVDIPQKRWGIGIQLGAGYDGRGVTPYIGVGFTYNLIFW